MIKVGYDGGHGGFGVTAGKRTPDGEYEWDFNNKIARAFANELAFYEGVASKRFDDPTGKTDVPLKARTDGANDWGADYYISFHHNALLSKWGSHGGVETWIYNNPKFNSAALANAIHPALVEAYGLRDRGIKKGNLHIVRETKMPSILIEGGFMDSTIDIKKLHDDQVLENVGKLIAQAFAKFVGLKRNVQEEAEELNFTSPTLRKMYEERLASSGTAKLVDDAAVEVLGYKSKLINGRLSDGDLVATAIELAIHFAKQK